MVRIGGRAFYSRGVKKREGAPAPRGTADLRGQVTELLRKQRDGNAADELLPLVYDELRRMARNLFRSERVNHTLQPTALVHEAYLRLVDLENVDWQGRQHFFATAARMMRRLLIDEARARRSAKRGGERKRVDIELVDGSLFAGDFAEKLSIEEVLALDQALDRLAVLEERQARVVELRFFGGLDSAETAELLGVSLRTVEGDWTHAKAWLRRELGRTPPIEA